METVLNPITEKQYDDWVDTLRGDKYKQGQDQLKNEDNTYCCLGVANDMFDLQCEDHYLFLTTTSDTNLGMYKLIPRYLQEKLADMNDGGKSFTEIADYLEEHKSQLFKYMKHHEVSS